MAITCLTSRFIEVTRFATEDPEEEGEVEEKFFDKSTVAISFGLVATAICFINAALVRWKPVWTRWSPYVINGVVIFMLLPCNVYFDRELLIYLMIHVLFLVTNYFTRKEQIFLVLAVMVAYDAYLLLYEAPKNKENDEDEAQQINMQATSANSTSDND